MALSPEQVLAVAKKFTKDSLEGVGAIAGKPCQIQSITPITGGNRITFLWVDNSGVEHTQTLDVYDGAKGDKGDKGDRGAIGPQGSQGIQGVQGPAGPKGDTGAQGIQGIQGEQGIQGIKGDKGDDGYPFLIYKQYDDISEFSASDFPEIGLMFMVMQEDYDPEDPTTSIGYPIYRYTGTGTPPYSLVVHLASQGIKGEKGDKGDTGAQGPKGDTGEQGAKGDKGDKGDTGAQGIQGEQGIGLPEGGNAEQILAKNSNEDYDFYWKTTGSAAFKDANGVVRPHEDKLVDGNAVYSAINNALSSVYSARGDITVAELTASLLVAANVGNVYELSDSGTTTALFLQGAGVPLEVGDNVGIIQAGPSTYLFNKMAGAFDLTEYQKKDLTTPLTIGGVSQTTVEGALGGLNGLVPSGASSSNKLATNSQLSTIAKAYDGATYTTSTALLNALATDIANMTSDGGTIGCVWTGKSYFCGTYSRGNVRLFFENPIGGYRSCEFALVAGAVSNPTWFNEQPTSSVTSDSTAPITSGGVYDALLTKMGVSTGGIDSSILTDIKATADAASDYYTFTGRTQASVEGGWFGFKKNVNFWHCTFWSGGGMVIHIIYNSGTYTQKVWNDGSV